MRAIAGFLGPWLDSSNFMFILGCDMGGNGCTCLILFALAATLRSRHFCTGMFVRFVCVCVCLFVPDMHSKFVFPFVQCVCFRCSWVYQQKWLLTQSESGHLHSFHWGHFGEDGSDKKQRQPQFCHEVLAAVQLHSRHVNWLEDELSHRTKIADAGRCQRTKSWWNLPVLTNQQIVPFGLKFKFLLWLFFFLLTCHRCATNALLWCLTLLDIMVPWMQMRLRQLTNSVRTVGISRLLTRRIIGGVCGVRAILTGWTHAFIAEDAEGWTFTVWVATESGMIPPPGWQSMGFSDETFTTGTELNIYV